MPRYTLSWLELAREAYDSLPLSRRDAVDERLNLLVDHPTTDAQHDSTTGWWVTTYANHTGLLLYGISGRHLRVVVLRLQDLG